MENRKDIQIYEGYSLIIESFGNCRLRYNKGVTAEYTSKITSIFVKL